jgi:hypothetical protein
MTNPRINSALLSSSCLKRRSAIAAEASAIRISADTTIYVGPGTALPNMRAIESHLSRVTIDDGVTVSLRPIHRSIPKKRLPIIQGGA